MGNTARKLLLTLAITAATALVLSGPPAQAKSHHHATTRHSVATSKHSTAKKRRTTAKAVQDARRLFAAKKLPSAQPQSSIGSYTNGCIAGASTLPVDGPHWQVMRLSRNRHYGNSRLIDFIQGLSDRANKLGWNGLLIGDMSMPRGGPMPTGHASHNIGLDVDIWLRPAPDHTLTNEERETWSANSVLTIDTANLDPNVWTQAHADFVKAAASSPNVARVFMTPAIKKYLCDRKDPNGADTDWLRKSRPCHDGVCEGHDDHIHVRLTCPPGDKACVAQAAQGGDDGCGAELTEALKEVAKDPPYTSIIAPSETKNPFPLSRMPKACVGVLNAKP
jgi:penicillin-insensitive murein endopeptidase